MALAALIAAYHESAEPAALRATLPLAGRSVLERQIRLAAAAGAARILVLAERIPAPLAAALDRLRRERLPLQLARTAEEAAAIVDPNDRLLLLADGAVADPAELNRLVAAEGPAVLTVPDSGYGELYERIDAESRWAGLLAVDGAMLRETVSMLRDWDLQSTLLRRTLQSGARHLAAEGPVAIVDSQVDLAALERRILASADRVQGGWASRLLAPLERIATSAVMGAPFGPRLVGTAAAALTVLGAAGFAYGWFRSGLVALLLATPLEGIALRLGRLRMRGEPGRSWWCALLPFFAGAALVALAYALADAHGWGMMLLAFTTLAFLAAQSVELEGRTVRGAVWLADRKGMIWLMLPFALFGAWQAGLAALFAYAAASFFWAQRQVHAARAAGED